MVQAQPEPILPEDRIQRLYALYREINDELDQLEKEGRLLREEIQAAIDKRKMKEILKKVVELP